MALLSECRTQHRVYIIAEIGVNHDGDVAKAHALVDAVATCGVDAVKVQTFSAERLALSHAQKARYQVETTGASGSQLDMLKKLELDADAHFALRDQAESLGVEFFSTPYDLECLDFLVHEVNVPIVKIASADVVNTPLLVAAGASGCDVILSTGMSSIEEVRRGVAAVGLGMRSDSARPGYSELDTFDPLTWPWGEFAQRLMLMQCTSQYPASPRDCNLRAIETIASATGLQVGYSDHTESITSAVLALGFGAPALEKHFTLDRSAAGPDHRASLDVESMKAYVATVREAELCIGDGIKRPSPAEAANRGPMRRGLYASRNIVRGEIVTADDIWLARPADGISPEHFWDIAGSRANRDINSFEALDHSDVEQKESETTT